MSCQLPFVLLYSEWNCELPRGHYGPHAAFDHGAKLEWPNPDTPLPVGRLPAEPGDHDVLAERFARDLISKEATIERLQALLADVTLQRNEFFARLERVEQAACEVISDQAGRLPALDALLGQWEADRQKHFETIDRLEKLGEGCPRAARYNGWVYGLEQCMGELKAVVAGLRADPATRQLLEEKDDQGSRVETGATLPRTRSTAFVDGGDQ